MSELIDALDDALGPVGSSEGAGEDVILERVFGGDGHGGVVRVTCRAKVNAMTQQEIAAGINESDLSLIMSPSQINAAQWPGGTMPHLPPYKLDQRIPRMTVDRAIVRGQARIVSFAAPSYVGGELVRLDLRVTG